MQLRHEHLKRLHEIKGRVDKAAPGPWECCHHLQSREKDNSCPCGNRGDIWSKALDTQLYHLGQRREKDGMEWFPPVERQMEIDTAQFVANAREDVPYLIGMIEELIEVKFNEMANKP